MTEHTRTAEALDWLVLLYGFTIRRWWRIERFERHELNRTALALARRWSARRKIKVKP